MGTAELSQRTAVNVQEKANLIWAKLFEDPSFYGRVMEEMGRAMYFNLKNGE